MTTKHHDGIALFDTKFSERNVLAKTPAGRDLVAPYVEAMRKAGLKVGLYYSLIDWSDPRYRTVYPEGESPEDHLQDVFATPAGHPMATVLKVELEGEITYNLGHGEVVTQN